MSFCPKIGAPGTLEAITSYADLWFRWGLKQSCTPHQETSNDMWHTTCMHIIQGNSWFLVVESQMDTLTPNPSFDHNLCFKCSNGLGEPILNIYVSRTFQWYNELFNAMCFDPWNISFENLGFHKASNSQSGNPFGNVWVHSFTFMGVQMWVLGYTFDSHLFMPLPWS
jgi:hypothetical protein